MPGRQRDAIDQLIGRNIRLLRLARGMSQTDLAKHLNLTFQQVQKYENGTNRVSSGRLCKIATVLRTPITAFFDGADLPACDPAAQSPAALPHALRLVQAFCALENTDMRRSLADLVEILAARSK